MGKNEKIDPSIVLDLLKKINSAPLSQNDRKYFNEVRTTIQDMLKKDKNISQNQFNYLQLTYNKYKDILDKRDRFDYTKIIATVVAINPCGYYKLDKVYKVTIDINEIKQQMDIILPTEMVKKIKILNKYTFKKNGAEKLAYSLEESNYNNQTNGKKNYYNKSEKKQE